MKKICFFLMIIGCIICTGCSSEEIKTYNYGVHISWTYFESEEELIEESSHIFEGVVVDLDFYIYNNLREEVQQTPVDPEEAQYCYLYTVYEIAVIRTYKGNTSFIEKVCLMGGVPDQRKEEQKKVLEQVGIYDPDKGIPLVKGDTKHVKLNETYLFCVQGEDGEKKYASPAFFAFPEEQLFPNSGVFDQEEILRHLPYVPHPLLIFGVAAAVIVLVGVVTFFVIRARKKKKEEAEIPEDE